jgi:hypothetical protein
MTTRILTLLTLAFLAAPIPTVRGQTPARADKATSHSYYYKGQLVTLDASLDRVALVARKGARVAGADALTKQGLARMAVSDLPAAVERGISFVQVRTSGRNAQVKALTAQQESALQADGYDVQPVFEQGDFTAVPTEEILVGLASGGDRAELEALLAPHRAAQGIKTIRDQSRGLFVVSISSPAKGRAFAVARFLSTVSGVAYAEPNLALIRNLEVAPPQPVEIPGGQKVPVVPETGKEVRPTTPAPPSPTAAGLTILTEMDAESATFPPTGWKGYYGASNTVAYWSRTAVRARSGSYSAYCTGGGSGGVAAPGPVPYNTLTWLESPPLDLTGYEEVYVEGWFYAKNDLYSGRLYDLAAVYAVGSASTNAIGLGIYSTGDCTTDPTTAAGWRKFVMRIPPAGRTAAVYIWLAFWSDNYDRFEGTYVDDLRVVGMRSLDSVKPSNDTYSGRQWELSNSGQILGLGTGADDLEVPEAWSLVSVSTSIVIAVIDEGVEATHPDLNVVDSLSCTGGLTGFTVGSHGTAVAGNAAARGNNSLGVTGTAPGARVLSVHYGASYADMAKAVDTAVARGARVLNNSWGWVGTPSAAIEQSVTNALAAGCVVLFAAGNGPDRPPYSYNVAFPGSLCASSAVITVGATGLQDDYKGAASSDGQFSWGSSYINDGPDVCAPSPWSYTTDRTGTNGYNTGALLADANYTTAFGGTSSSTPKTAGIVALMLSANPRLTPAQVKQILRDTADDIDAPGIDDRTGAGRVNAYRAVQRALAIASNRAPVVSARAPASDRPAVAAGGSVALSAVASDPEGDALTFRWSLDGTNVTAATGAAWTLTTLANQLGPRQVLLTVADAWGNTTGVAWRVSVGAGDPNLVAHWSFANGSGTDYSGSGNTLSLTGRVQITWDGVENSALKALAP